MQARIAVLVLSLLAFQAASAQLRIGAKAGANIVKVDGVSFDDQFRYGYHLGGFAEIPLTENKKLWLQPEVLFSQYSTTLDSSYKNVYQNIINGDQRQVKLNYLSIPILVNYKLVGPLYLQAGPAFSVLTNQDKNFLQNGAEAFRNGDFSMIGGAQLRLSKLSLNGRYVVGLSNINDIDNRDKWKSQAIQVSVGLSF